MTLAWRIVERGEQRDEAGRRTALVRARGCGLLD